MSKRLPYINTAPADLPAGASREAVLREFANRLQWRRAEKGWNQSELARQAAQHMPSKKFGRDNISNYERAEVFPGSVHLMAVAKALGCEPRDLVPSKGLPSSGDRIPSFRMEDIGGGMWWLRIDKPVPFEVAHEVARLVNSMKEEKRNDLI